jgi:hypothetical protein
MRPSTTIQALWRSNRCSTRRAGLRRAGAGRRGRQRSGQREVAARDLEAGEREHHLGGNGREHVLDRHEHDEAGVPHAVDEVAGQVADRCDHAGVI